MRYLNSSAIRAVNYDRASGALTVWFTSGGTGYDYYNVPEHIYAGLINAGSHGTYFHQYIREQYAA